MEAIHKPHIKRVDENGVDLTKYPVIGTKFNRTLRRREMAAQGLKKVKFGDKRSGRRYNRKVVTKQVEVVLPPAYNKAGKMLRDVMSYIKTVVSHVILTDNWRGTWKM